MKYLILIAGWVVYFALHSILASGTVKERMSQWMGKGFRFYRLFYTFISVGGLLALLFLNGSIASPYFFESKGYVRYASFMFTTFGVMTIQIALRQFGFKSFIGIATESTEFTTTGILKLIRHPIYSGIILIVLGLFLFIPNLPTAISCLIMYAYLPIGIYLEEKKLIATFGEVYRKYKEEVPALIPRLSK